MYQLCRLSKLLHFWVSFVCAVKWDYTILPEIVVLKVKRDKVCESVWYKVLFKDKKKTPQNPVFSQSQMFKT